VWGLWTWLSERSKARASAPAAMTQSLATFQAALNEQAQALIQSFKDEVAEMRGRIESLEAENESCRTENAKALSRIGMLEVMLQRAGVELPATQAVS
jgi:chromosome segregation ATPase